MRKIEDNNEINCLKSIGNYVVLDNHPMKIIQLRNKIIYEESHHKKTTTNTSDDGVDYSK